MGTSKGYGGAKSGLVPSWVDDPSPGVAPGAVPVAPGGVPQPGPPPPSRTKPDTSGAGSFQGARSLFSRFAKTGSQSALGGALSSYVRNGTGGARRAARRMGVSRAAGATLLGVIRNVQNLGAAETLRQLNLPGLAGRSAADVFLAMLEFVCPPGGAIDEAIARQAMLESIGDLAEAGVGDFDAMTSDQLREFFLDFIAHSIEGRVMADLGARGVTLPTDVATVEAAQQQLHDFVTGCTQSELSGRLNGVGQLDDRDMDRVVNEIYEAAFELVAAAGEAAR